MSRGGNLGRAIAGLVYFVFDGIWLGVIGDRIPGTLWQGEMLTFKGGGAADWALCSCNGEPGAAKAVLLAWAAWRIAHCAIDFGQGAVVRGAASGLRDQGGAGLLDE